MEKSTMDMIFKRKPKGSEKKFLNIL